MLYSICMTVVKKKMQHFYKGRLLGRVQYRAGCCMAGWTRDP